MSAARRDERVDHRGIVLAGVLVVVVILALISATALVAADAEMSAAQGSLRREQARALAWSGVRAVMAELGRQRAEIMDGAMPEVTNSWALFGEAAGSGGPGGVIQLVEIEPGRYAAPEAGKLDLNTVSAEMLTASGAVDEAAARSIVSARGSGVFGSVEEALAGARSSGSGAESEMASGGDAEAALTEGSAGSATASTDEERAMRLLTVFAFEPNVQMGLGDSGSDYAGKPRIYIGDGWRDELKGLLDERLGEKLGGDVAAALREGAVQSMGPVINRLRKRGVVVKDWAEVLDAVTMSPDRYVAGRVDVLTAPVEVLRGVPGIDGQAAEQIVRTRDRMDTEARHSVVWLAQQGVLTEAQFETAVDLVTCRSMQWRVRVQAGFNAPAGASERSGSAEPAALRDRVVLEAVVDVSGSTPRLAYLRDITMMEIQPAVAQLVGPAGEGVASEPAGGTRPGQASSPEEEGGLEMDAGLDLKMRAKPKGLNVKRMELGGGMKSSRMDLSSDLKMDTDLDVGADSSSKGSTTESDDDALPRPGPTEGGTSGAAGAKELTPGVDRRFGRWKIPSRSAGRAGGSGGAGGAGGSSGAVGGTR